MTFNKIIVLGAGAIGSLYGALLSKSSDVLLIANKAHSKTVTEKGLLLKGAKNGVFRVDARPKVDEIPPKALLIIAVKAQDLESSVRAVAPLLRSDTLIFILQNGIGNEGVAREAAGKEVFILRGITTFGAEMPEPGVVSFLEGETVVEPGTASEEVLNLFEEAGLNPRVACDMRMELWRKLVINCVANPLGALLHAKNNEVADELLTGTRSAIVCECLRVADAEGVYFKEDMLGVVDGHLVKYSNYSSMCQDMMKGRKTEIGFLNEKVVELGRKHSIPTPVNEALVALIKFMEVHSDRQLA